VSARVRQKWPQLAEEGIGLVVVDPVARVRDFDGPHGAQVLFWRGMLAAPGVRIATEEEQNGTRNRFPEGRQLAAPKLH
jgi:hypothetical protein